MLAACRALSPHSASTGRRAAPSPDGTFAVSSAELYNPATGTWSVTGSMHQGRSSLDGYGPSATLLPGGEVLVAGGEDANFNLLSSAELYNPAAGTWSRTGSMTAPRSGQSATLLNNGQVLVAGGTGATAAAELYNPATGKFTPTGSMISAHGTNVGTLLPDGDVLVTGRAETFAELYHPATGQWSNASAGLPVCLYNQGCRIFSTATLLGTGNVLVAGGLVGLISNPQTSAGAMLYHPGTNTWTSTGSMTTQREGQTRPCSRTGRSSWPEGRSSTTPRPQSASPAPNSTPRRPGATTRSVSIRVPSMFTWP